MRWLAALLVVCAGCSGSSDGECKLDSDCGTGVCARDSECLPASQVRAIRVTWTIRGEAASETTCAKTPSFYLTFSSYQVNDYFGFEPVPCKTGVFSVDKMPRRFTSAEIGVDRGFSDVRAFDANGNAAFDLFP